MYKHFCYLGVFEIKDSLTGKYLTTQGEKVILGDSKTEWHWIPNKENSVWGYIYQPDLGYLSVKSKTTQLTILKEKKIMINNKGIKYGLI